MFPFKKKHTLSLSIAVLAIALSSFDKSNNNKLNKTKVYYALKSGTSFVWTQTLPNLEDLECVTLEYGPYSNIEVEENFTPTDGETPRARDLVSHSEHRGEYEPIP